MAIMTPKIIKTGAPRNNKRTDADASEKVIEKEILLAHEKAREILEEAQTKAKELIHQAQEEAQALLSEAYEKGYAEGLEQWLQCIQKIKREQENAFKAMEQNVLAIALKVAEKIVRKEFSTNPSTLHPYVKEAFRYIQGFSPDRVRLYVHPTFFQEAMAQKQTFEKALGPDSEVTVFEDESLEPGDFRLETEYGVVETKWETHFKALQKKLMSGSS